MPRRALSPFLVVVGLLSACPEPPPPPAPTQLRIRVRNLTKTPMERVLVYWGQQAAVVGTLGPGVTGDYRKVKRAYRYGYTEAVVAGKRLVIQPIDFVGETPLPPGDYTWGLSVDDGRLAMTLTRD